LEDRCVSEILYKIRHHEIGNNPFLIVIILSSEFGPMTINKFINNGVSDILVSPVSSSHLLKRIETLKDNQQIYVVTVDYIGPERRNDTRPETQQISRIAVPNVLNFKATPGKNEKSLERAIEATTKLVNKEKMDRQAFQISYLVDEIMPLYEADDVSDDVIALIERLEVVSSELVRRMAGTHKAYMSKLANTVLQVASSIAKSPLSPETTDLQLLPELGVAVQKAFFATDEEIQLVQDITDTVKDRSA
ncbi:MAG: hypothetical protein HON65_16315, partial [Rhodospirillales bacterium]|nr:hypothetical protein [Rhodospirillales bacterium]